MVERLPLVRPIAHIHCNRQALLMQLDCLGILAEIPVAASKDGTRPPLPAQSPTSSAMARPFSLSPIALAYCRSSVQPVPSML